MLDRIHDFRQGPSRGVVIEEHGIRMRVRKRDDIGLYCSLFQLTSYGPSSNPAKTVLIDSFLPHRLVLCDLQIVGFRPLPLE